ncbi:uncharacterized protein IL334_002272 [Kwoniella shivajii]|uniref:RING-type E3 ubiquitin transferase n=1 Tax=Kwoniella shivajii TaxID=564305 RepID=A0ABZ1CVY1_9TREE|nr:hypothetical protein IL334_002272 [Kwoniella shivajii]
MPRKQAVDQSIYLDEAEGFILEHALISPPRTWPPLPPEPQESRLVANRKKMDWEEEVKAHPDEPIDIPIRKHRDSNNSDEGEDDANKERCVICLMALRDRTIVGICGHEFCFECIGVWANQSRRCPLCSADMAPFLLHDLDAKTPTKFYLPPLPSRPSPTSSLPGPSRIRLPEMTRRQPSPEKVEPDELDLQVERRREIYRHELYVKHIGSNPHTRYRPNPTPRQISEDPILIQRATAFLRRELRVWSLIDVEFLTTYIISLLKTIDIRSEPAIRLLTDFLDINENEFEEFPPNASEHFAHELYSYLRSPFKELWRWDEVIQYDPVPSHQSHRSRSPSPARKSHSASRSQSPPLPPPPRPRSASPSSCRSRSRSPKRGRQWSRRDVFVPSISPDAKRWDENDTWLDPDYAQWLEEEKRRDHERRERKRSRRASEREIPNGREQKPMRAWGQPIPKKVELLPDPGEPPLRMDELVEEPEVVEVKEEQDIIKEGMGKNGLSIRGAAKSVEPQQPTTLTARQKLLEKLAKAKAQSATPIPQKSTSTCNGMTVQQITMRERLAKLKAESSWTGFIPDPDSISDDKAIVSPKSNLAEISPPPIPHTISDPTSSSQSATGVRALVRARIKMKLKLESEKATFRRNVNESKAQELRRRLLESKAKKEAEEVINNYGGMDKVLRKMTTEERKKEVRRRLMMLKMIEAETENERRTRELKEKLLARKQKISSTANQANPPIAA